MDVSKHDAELIRKLRFVLNVALVKQARLRRVGLGERYGSAFRVQHRSAEQTLDPSFARDVGHALDQEVQHRGPVASWQ